MTIKNMHGLPSELAEFIEEVLNDNDEDLSDNATKEQVLEKIKLNIKKANRLIELRARYPQFAREGE